MKKVLLTFLALILCTAAVLVACGEKDKGDESNKLPSSYVPMVTDSKAMIVVVRPDNATKTEKAQAVVIKEGLTELLGTAVSITADWNFDMSKYPEGTYFVCVGKTNLDVSTEFLSSASYDMYGVMSKDNMIAVASSNDIYLELAVKEFMKAFVTIDGACYLDTAKLDYNSGKITSAGIVSNKRSDYTIVVENTKGKSEYPEKIANSISEAIKEAFGAELPVKSPASSYDKEIIVGVCPGRDVAAELAADLCYNEFYISLQENGSIVICGKNYETTEQGVKKFIELAKAQEISGEFNFASVLSGKYTVEGTPSVPLFENSKDFELISGTLGSSAMYYKNTSAEKYENYLTQLSKSGFELVSKNQINGNTFATYQNSEAIINCYFTAHDSSVRVCVDSKKVTDIHNFTPQDTKAVTTPMLIQFTSGCGYIVRLEDGTFVIYDSGMNNDDVYKNLYNSLNKYNVTGEKPVVRAWIYSHPHIDHYGGFFKFCESYGSSIMVMQFVVNNPSRNHYYLTIDDAPNGDVVLEERIFKFYEYCEKYYPGADFVTAHTGQIMYFGSTKVEILHTHEDDYPNHILAGNQISVLARFTVGNQTVLFTGDMHQTSAPTIVKMFGSHLKSYMLQMPHHGYNGGTAEFYNAVKAEICLFTNDYENYIKLRGQEQNVVGIKLAKQVLVPTDEKDIMAFELPYKESFGTKWNRK